MQYHSITNEILQGRLFDCLTENNKSRGNGLQTSGKHKWMKYKHKS